MRVTGHSHLDVEIDPIFVLQKLIDEEIGEDNWVIADSNEHYKCEEVHRNFTKRVKISKETFEYVQALQKVKEYLKIKRKDENNDR